jgi:hypothetical protein
MRRRSPKELFYDLGAATAVVLLPMAIYFKHHDYPVGNPESLLILTVTLVAGLLWGLLMNLGGTPGRMAVVVFLALLTVDIQTDWFTTWELRLLLNLVFFGAVAWFLRRRLSEVTLVLAGAMLLGTLVMPARDLWPVSGPPLTEPAPRQDIPFVLHIVLDEHIGIEGNPREFDPDRAVADHVRGVYQEHGFRVYGRAYSNYYRTIMTLSNLLNYTSSDDPAAYVPYPYGYRQTLEENAWFDLLDSKGYRIRVYQTEYLAFGEDADAPRPGGPVSSVTVPMNSINPLAPVEMPAVDKARFIMGNYTKLSWILSSLRDRYRDLRLSGLGRALALPIWDQSGEQLGTLTAMNALDLLEQDLDHAGPGRAFFAHVLIPHFPYTYDRDCEILEMKDGWLEWGDPDLVPLKNDGISRGIRYRAYQDQLVCAANRIGGLLEKLAREPWWDDAVVVVHGDHGSRIDFMQPTSEFAEEFTAQGLMDGFSTLFAVKAPGAPAGYDRRQLPIGHLFKRVVIDGIDPGDQDWETRPRVFIENELNPLVEMNLPFFDHGLPAVVIPDSSGHRNRF